MVDHTCNASTQEAEVAGLRISGHPELDCIVDHVSKTKQKQQQQNPPPPIKQQ
jgi:hypothetical protein